MSNPYLEKIASLGDKDYRYAIDKTNVYRTRNGLDPLDHKDESLKKRFKETRGTTGRVVGTALGIPALGPVGMTAGYFIGKSHDNKIANRDFTMALHQESSEEVDKKNRK